MCDVCVHTTLAPLYIDRKVIRFRELILAARAVSTCAILLREMEADETCSVSRNASTLPIDEVVCEDTVTAVHEYAF